MDTLLHRFGEKIKGCLKGFDRIIFKGITPDHVSGRHGSIFTEEKRIKQRL